MAFGLPKYRCLAAAIEFTLDQLQADFADSTRVKTSFVREAKSKENRFMTLLNGGNTLLHDAKRVELLEAISSERRGRIRDTFETALKSRGRATL